MAKKKNFFEKPWTQITGVTIIIITILGGGYAAGCYQEKIQWRIPKIIFWAFPSVGLSVPIFLFVPLKKDFHWNP